MCDFLKNLDRRVGHLRSKVCYFMDFIFAETSNVLVIFEVTS